MKDVNDKTKSENQASLQEDCAAMAKFINESLIPEKVNFGRAAFAGEDIERMNNAFIAASKFMEER